MTATISQNSPQTAVPVFDGRTQFQLGKYWENLYTGDVVKGSTVMLLFTIKKAPLPAGVVMPGLKSALYCNILGIVVLAEPSDTYSQTPSQETANDLGVDSIKELDGGSEADAGEDPLI